MKQVTSKDILNRANEIMDIWYEQYGSPNTKPVIERGLITWDIAYELTKFKNYKKDEMYGVVFIEYTNLTAIRWKGVGTYFNRLDFAKEHIEEYKKAYGDGL